MRSICIHGIVNSTDLIDKDAFIFWHPKKPEQFKAKVADVFPIPNTIYMADGKLTPKIVYTLEQAQDRGLLYTLI